MPGSIEESLQALEDDYDFMLGKRSVQRTAGRALDRLQAQPRNQPVRMRPHPIEFSMYFDA